MIKAVIANMMPKAAPQFGCVSIKKEYKRECKSVKSADEAINTMISELKDARRCDVYPCIHFDNQEYGQFKNIIKIVQDEVSDNPCLKRLVTRVQFKDSGEGKEVMMGQLRAATDKTIIEFLQSNKGRDSIKYELDRLAKNIITD